MCVCLCTCVDGLCFVQELEFNWRIVVATVMGFLGSGFGTVGGVGGGGIFVPMLTLIVGFDTKSAAALSKCNSPSSCFPRLSLFLYMSTHLDYFMLRVIVILRLDLSEIEYMLILVLGEMLI